MLFLAQNFQLKKLISLFFVSSVLLFLVSIVSFAQSNDVSEQQQNTLTDTINLTILKVTDREISIKWETSEKTSAVVYYGTDQTNLTNQILENAFLKTHTMTIFNLEPQTKYYFQTKSISENGNQYNSNIVEAQTLEDKKGPANVSDIKISFNEQNEMILSWENPKDLDFEQVIIKENDKELYSGKVNQFLLSFTQSQPKTLSMFSSDKLGNLSSGVSFTIFTDGKLKKEQLDQKFEILPKKDIYIFASPNNKGSFLLSPINNQAKNNITVYGGDKIIFSLNPKVFPKSVSEAFVEIDSIKYLFKKNDQYLQTDVTFPKNEKDFIVSVVVQFQDLTKQIATYNFFVKKHPQVFQTDNLKNNNIANAKVSLYWQNPNTGAFELWAGSLFDQSNPVFTDENGNYSFYVLSGNYKIKVQKNDFKDFESEIFKVSDSVISKNIQLLKDEPSENVSDNILSTNKSDSDKNTIKSYNVASMNKTIQMLPFLIFTVLGFFVIVGSILALILLRLHLPHYHSIKKHVSQIHKDLESSK